MSERVVEREREGKKGHYIEMQRKSEERVERKREKCHVREGERQTYCRYKQ